MAASGPGAERWTRRRMRKEREREWTGPRWPAWTHVFMLSLSHLHRQNVCFPPLTFFSFHYTPQNISGPILFLFSPCLLCHWSCLNFFSFNFLLSFFIVNCLSFYCTSKFTFSPHLSCSGLAVLCILLTCCSAVFWRWMLIFIVRALQRPYSSPNHLHSSCTHIFLSHASS